MPDLPASTAPTSALHPLVKGRCPACNGASLFLGSGGYVTCSRLDCPNPSGSDQLLHGEWSAPATEASDVNEVVTDPSWSVQCRPPGCGAQPGQRCRRWDGNDANVSCDIRWREYDRQQAAKTTEPSAPYLMAEHSPTPATGYCPSCGRGDCAPTPEAYEEQRQRTVTAEHRLRLAHQARRAKEHQLDDIRRALCDAGLMEDNDPYSYADLADVIRQAGEGLHKDPTPSVREQRERPTHADGTPYSYYEITAEGWGFCAGCHMWSTATPDRPHQCQETHVRGPVQEGS